MTDGTYLRSSMPWIRGTVLDPEPEDYSDLGDEEYDVEKDFGDGDLGLFHVTTRVSEVLKSGRLKSRNDLGHDNLGLGGGDMNDDSDLISVCVHGYRAIVLRDAMITMALAARGEITASEALQEALQWTGFPDNLYYPVEEEEEDADENDLLALVGISSVDAEQVKWGRIDLYADEINALHDTPEKAYNLIVGFESRLCSTFYENEDSVKPFIGFTAPWETYRRVNPNQIDILKIEALRGASAEIIYEEGELRFRPQDVQLVR